MVGAKVYKIFEIKIAHSRWRKEATIRYTIRNFEPTLAYIVTQISDRIYTLQLSNGGLYQNIKCQDTLCDVMQHLQKNLAVESSKQ